MRTPGWHPGLYSVALSGLSVAWMLGSVPETVVPWPPKETRIIAPGVNPGICTYWHVPSSGGATEICRLTQLAQCHVRHHPIVLAACACTCEHSTVNHDSVTPVETGVQRPLGLSLGPSHWPGHRRVPWADIAFDRLLGSCLTRSDNVVAVRLPVACLCVSRISGHTIRKEGERGRSPYEIRLDGGVGRLYYYKKKCISARHRGLIIDR